MNWALPQADSYFAPVLARDPRGFEIDHLDLVVQCCRRYRLAVDGGAHIGTWSAALAGHFARVVAFEPAADTFDCLKQNVANLPSVFPKHYALGERRGRATVTDDPTRAGNTGSRYVVNNGDRGDVDVVPIDYFGFEDLDLLKLDVEGAELAALRGAAGTIDRCRPVIMIEVKRLRAGHDPEAAVRWLGGIGYREVARARNDRVFTR